MAENRILRSPFTIVLASLVLFALILTRIPLFNVLGFEFSAAIGLALGIALPPLVIHRLRQRPGSFWRSFLHSIGEAEILLIPLLVIILLNAFLVKNCDILEGMAFYLLIPGVTGIYVVTLSFFWGCLLRRRALLACYAHLLLTILLALYNIIFHPPVFVYHSLIGFFPGPIYDERVSMTMMFLLARGITLLFAFALLWTAYVLYAGRQEGSSLRGDWRKWLILSIALGASGVVWWQQAVWGFRPTRSSIQRALGGRYETEHFVLYYDLHSDMAADIQQVAMDHEFRYAQLANFFELEMSHKIGSYIYASPEQKKHLMGARYTPVEDPISDEIHIRAREFPHPALKHELAHVLAANFHPIFKVSLKMGLHEGIAVAAEWDDGALTVHQWSKAMRELGLAPDVQDIINTWGFWTESASRSYTLAGSFVRFLVDTRGMDAFKKVFPMGNFQKAYGKSLDVLVNEWTDFLESVPLESQERTLAEYRFKNPSIFSKPCAHEIAEWTSRAWSNYSQGAYVRAIEQFQRIRDWDPANPRHLRGLLYAFYASGDLQRATEVAQQIIHHPNASQRLIGMTRKILGDIHWEQSQFTEAAALYVDVYQRHFSAADDREMAIKLHALASPHRTIFRQILLGRQIINTARQRTESISEAGKMLRLKQILVDSGDPAASYLIGRRLFFDKDYAWALTYLQRFLDAEVSSRIPEIELTISREPHIRAEAHRLAGMASYHLRLYDQAISYFQIWHESDRPLGELERARDWIERCQWERSAQFGRTTVHGDYSGATGIGSHVPPVTSASFLWNGSSRPMTATRIPAS